MGSSSCMYLSNGSRTTSLVSKLNYPTYKYCKLINSILAWKPSFQVVINLITKIKADWSQSPQILKRQVRPDQIAKEKRFLFKYIHCMWQTECESIHCMIVRYLCVKQTSSYRLDRVIVYYYQSSDLWSKVKQGFI